MVIALLNIVLSLVFWRYALGEASGVIPAWAEWIRSIFGVGSGRPSGVIAIRG